jgi:hypothetical protein
MVTETKHWEAHTSVAIGQFFPLPLGDYLCISENLLKVIYLYVKVSVIFKSLLYPVTLKVLKFFS